MTIIVTANEGRTQGPDGVRSDMLTIRNHFPIGRRPIIGWQEIDEADPADEHQILADVFGGRWRTLFRNLRVPITLPPGLRPLDVWSTRATPGIPKVSPPRWITEVQPGPRAPRRHWAPRVVLNQHFTAGAFNRDTRERAETERRAHWEKQLRIARERVAFHIDRGRTVIAVSDDNRQNMPKLHPRELRVWETSIESITVIPAEGVKVDVRDVGTIPLRSDHPARWADVRLEVRR